MIELGTRLGKCWFAPRQLERAYPFHSRWGDCRNLVELAQSEHFQQVFAMPFATIVLETDSPVEAGWRKAGLPESFCEAVTREYCDVAAHLYRTYRDRAVTFVLQHWEGDWLPRGAASLGPHVVAVEVGAVAQIQSAADDDRMRPARAGADHMDAAFDFEALRRTGRERGLAASFAEEV